MVALGTDECYISLKPILITIQFHNVSSTLLICCKYLEFKLYNGKVIVASTLNLGSVNYSDEILLAISPFDERDPPVDLDLSLPWDSSHLEAQS